MSSGGFFSDLGNVINAAVDCIKAGAELLAEDQINSTNNLILISNVLRVGIIASAIFGMLLFKPVLIVSALLLIVELYRKEIVNAEIEFIFAIANIRGLRNYLHGGDNFLFIFKRPITVIKPV